MWYDRVFLIIGCILHTQSVVGLWTCTQDSDCSSLSGGICTNGGCYCPPGQESVLGGTVCVNLATYHTSTCVEDHQCSRLTTAFECRRTSLEEGSCHCQAGFHYFLGRCWPMIDYGGACTRNEECLSIMRDPYSLSCNGTCQCADGYYSRQRGECRRIGYAIGDGCVLDEDCQFVNGACDVETLRCYNVNTGPLNTMEVQTQSTVQREVNIDSRQEGTGCNASSTCPEPFICTSLGSCVCPVGYYGSADGSLCYAELGSPTNATDLCVGLFAEVRDGICTCPANFFFEENMRDCTKATRRITDSCVTDSNCFTFGAASRCGSPQPPWYLRTCECNPELAVWDSGRNMCRLFAGVGESCEVDSDCLAGELEIQCVHNDLGQGFCTCPEGLQAVDGLCVTTGLGLGDACQATIECTETPNTVCEGGRCSCEPDYVADGDICAPTIGGTCVQDIDCVIENTVCETNNNQSTCQCGSNFVQSNEICWPVATGFDGMCNVTEQCRATMGESATCRDGICVCIDGFHYRDGGCWQRTGLFESCRRTSECYLSSISERVVCRNSLCQCEFDYPYSEELGTCTSSATVLFGNLLMVSTAFYYLVHKQINSDI